MAKKEGVVLMTFKDDTFTGLTKQMDVFIDKDDRYLTVKKITCKRVDVKNDYYWTGTITF
jgi:hypothetical protein